MKALMYRGDKILEIVNTEKPTPKEGQVLLKVKACGICGSDVHGWLGLTGRRKAPMVMGHEFSAEIEAYGSGCEKKLAIGALVTVQPCMSCQKCEYCLSGNNNACPDRRFLGTMDIDGALQEYICVPEKNIFSLPGSMSPGVGALIEPFAVSYSGIKKAGNLADKNVLIIGGGTIGQFALMAAKTKKPKKIVLADLSKFRLSVAEKLGADAVLNPSEADFDEKLRAAFDGSLADAVIECVGVSATAQKSIEALSPMGTAVWIGNSAKMVEINMQSIVTQSLKIIGTYTFTHEEFGESIKYIEETKLDLGALISAEVPLSNAAEMFEELDRNMEKYVKSIITF